MRRTVCAFCLLLAFSWCCSAQQGFEQFITRQGDKLMEGQREFRFISFNIPNLHYVEDNVPFEETNDWRLPDEFEITDALTAIKQMGGRVARMYTLSVRKPGEDQAIPRHILGPGQFNEEAFRALDKVLEVANKTGVRVIIPFVDNWVWWGGIAEYAAFRGKTTEQFWTNPQLIADFKKTIDYVVNRTNTYTGVKYKDDKAILAWETGNELHCPHNWTHEIAAYIKSLDQNHLVLDGFHTRILRLESIEDPAVDIVASHNYYQKDKSLVDELKTNRRMAKGKKPYFVGEFGFTSTAEVATFLHTVIDEGICGALIWSLRFRSRDGGFYWHSEPMGEGRYKAYHWPGFASGEPYDERNLLKLMRQTAFEIQHLAAPPVPIPRRPVLLPIEDVSAISWQGSAGATSYTIERAAGANGPWNVVGKDISDAAVPYRPLFSDRDVEIGKQYFYRVMAKNDSGVSGASNMVGPVKVRHMTIVDELIDYSLLHNRRDVILETTDTRKAKEDMNRLKGQPGSFIVYKLAEPVVSARVYALFPAEVLDIRLLGSADPAELPDSFAPISAQRRDFYSGKGEYGYWKPVLYQLRIGGGQTRFLKIEFAAEARISRVEINYGGPKPMKEKEIASELLGAVRKELGEDIVPFWLKYGADNQYGGFIGRMSNDLTVGKNAPKSLVLNARILWTFAALYRADQKPEYLQMAQRAYEYLMQNFWDKERGGAFWMLDYQGKPIDDSKELYGESFLVYALSEYFQATGDTQALEKAKELFALIEKYCHDNTNSGYYETFNRNWSPAEAARLATGSKTEKKTMNTHLHLLESYTSLYRIWQDERLRQRLEELIKVFVDYITDPKTYHFRLFFDEKWRPTGSVVSFGHDIEGSWLLCEAAEVLGDQSGISLCRISRMQQLAVKMAQAAYQEGLDTDGGLFYEGHDNKIINAEKHWWPQAEAVVGFLNAYQISKQQHFLLAAQQCWDFIDNHIVDHQFGEWFWMAPKGTRPSRSALKVSEWKCPYHNGRACLESIRRLQTISAGGSH